MKELIDQLIEIYARCKCSEVGEDSEYRTLLDKHEGVASFDQERARIELYKKSLEKRVGIQVTKQDEIREAIKVVNQVIKGKDSRHINDCITLIKKTYSYTWNQKQIQRFDTQCMALQNYQDYFLSFTTKGADDQNEKEVNRRYKFFIKNILGNKKYEEGKIRNNLLAESIHNLLNKEDLKGFFYYDKEGDNTYVDEKLKKAIENCFCFIQVVQNIMFEPGNPNYCFLEYKQAKTTIPDNCMYYVLAERRHEDLIPEFDVWINYEPWHTEVVRRDKIVLEFTETYNLSQLSKINKVLLEKLVTAIKQLKPQYIEDVPAD